jgi:hypothetical protein
MKTVSSFIAGLCLFVSSAIAQTINHPVLEKVQVSYKPVKTASPASVATAAPSIKVTGTVNVTLKAGYDAAKIYLKIKDKQTQVTVYEVNYMINSADVNDHGIIVYKKQDNILYITNPAVVTLKPYVYELYTEDGAGNQSVVYSIIQ